MKKATTFDTFIGREYGPKGTLKRNKYEQGLVQFKKELQKTLGAGFKMFNLEHINADMNSSTKKEKLTAYINYADESKINALYTLLEAEITEHETLWGDKYFLKEMDDRVNEFESGKARVATFEEIKKPE